MTTRSQNDAATTLYSGWRAQGVPTLITAHEAFALTDGKVGTEGDASASGGMSLSAVARRYAKESA